MMRLLVLTLFGLALTHSGQAQVLRFDGGAVAGINASQVHGDENGGFNKLGLSGGAFVDIRSPENYWGIRLEMHYAEKGSRRGNLEIGDPITEIRLKYIDIPVVFDLNLGDYQVGAGPYIGRLIKDELWERNSDTVRDLEEIKPWDLGGQAYARTPVGESAFFQVRISGSLLSIRSNSQPLGEYVLGPRSRNVALHFGIGWSLRGN